MTRLTPPLHLTATEDEDEEMKFGDTIVADNHLDQLFATTSSTGDDSSWSSQLNYTTGFAAPPEFSSQDFHSNEDYLLACQLKQTLLHQQQLILHNAMILQQQQVMLGGRSINNVAMTVTKGFVSSQNDKVIGGKRNMEVLPPQHLKICGAGTDLLHFLKLRVRLMVFKQKNEINCVQVLEDRPAICTKGHFQNAELDHQSSSSTTSTLNQQGAKLTMDNDLSSEDITMEENSVPSSPPVREDMDEYFHNRDTADFFKLEDMDEVCSTSSTNSPVISDVYSPVITSPPILHNEEYNLVFNKLCVKHSTHICGGFFFLRFELYIPATDQIVATVDGGRFQTITKRGLLKRGEKMKKKVLTECCISKITPSISVTNGGQLVRIFVTNLPQSLDLGKVQVHLGNVRVGQVYSAHSGCIVVETPEIAEGEYDVSVSLDSGKTVLTPQGETSAKMSVIRVDHFKSITANIATAQSRVTSPKKRSNKMKKR